MSTWLPGVKTKTWETCDTVTCTGSISCTEELNKNAMAPHIIPMKDVPLSLRPHLDQLIELAGSEENFLLALSATVVLTAVVFYVAFRLKL